MNFTQPNTYPSDNNSLLPSTHLSGNIMSHHQHPTTCLETVFTDSIPNSMAIEKVFQVNNSSSVSRFSDNCTDIPRSLHLTFDCLLEKQSTSCDKSRSSEEDSSDSLVSEECKTQYISPRVMENRNENYSLHYQSQTTSEWEWETKFFKCYLNSNENTGENLEAYLRVNLQLVAMLQDWQKIPSNFLMWESEVKSKKISLPTDRPMFKKTLVLDLDETLIHTDPDFSLEEPDDLLKISNQQHEHSIVPIILRPHLKEFLEFAAMNFEVISFTASCKEYADTVIRHIDPENKYFTYSFYRGSTVCFFPGIYIKDLDIIKNRDLWNILVVDNSILSYANHLSNLILVSSFFGDRDDNELEGLIGYLSTMVINTNDVRAVNRSAFQFEQRLGELREEMRREYEYE